MSKELINIRKTLHRFPELSGNETSTAERIAKELNSFQPDNLITGLGGTGVLAAFNAKESRAKKTILFRAELDAIAVTEESEIGHQSQNRGIMHGCGHDGHMAIILGLGRYLHQNPPKNLNVLLLFQPAEETGEGAALVMEDSRFSKLKIDQAFALHNLPGYEKNKIFIKKGTFACASTGVEITIKGRFSHAAYPEQGLNPALCVADLIQNAEKTLNRFREMDPLNKTVPTFIRMGEPAYGISPGEAKMGYTLRSATDEGLKKGLQLLEETIEASAKQFKGTIKKRRVEPFTATLNSDEGVKIIQKAAASTNTPLEIMDRPFPWSEDFGEFRKQFPITIFGLGAGKNHPHLHFEKYDFNDDLIPAGVKIFSEIVESYSAL